MTDVRTLLVGQRMLARVGLRAALKDGPEVNVLGEASTTAEAVEMTVRLRPSVVVVDTTAEDTDPVEATVALLRQCRPAPQVLVLANQNDRKVQAAVQAGANGLILAGCSPQEFAAAVHLAAAGYRLVAPSVATGRIGQAGDRPEPDVAERLNRARLDQLTEREFEVLQLVARGFGNAEISRSLQLSESTVKSHIRNILIKLGLRNRVHTVIYAYEVGFIRVGANQLAARQADALTTLPVLSELRRS
nr:response regulator transcription factor [Micromonospora sp. DSM 115978]